MSASENQAAETVSADFTRTWRYKIGLSMIIVGHLGILFAVVVMPFLGAGAGTVGGVVLGGELVSLASIIFLGKEGFKAIKSKAFAFIKASYARPVGKTRHYIGIGLLCANALTTYIMMLYAWDAFTLTQPEGPMPTIWGLDFSQQGSLVLWLFLIGEISFLVAIYVLGADWWGRFRRIFVWEAPAD